MDKYIVALDIGSTKTSVLIAEIDEEQVKFLALGAAESKGLRKGLIVNLDSTVSSIRRAVEEAEGVANVPVEAAVIGVAGAHVRGVNSRGGVSIGHRPRDIEREDVRRTSFSSMRRTAFAIQSAWSVNVSKPTFIWSLRRSPPRKIWSRRQIARES